MISFLTSRTTRSFSYGCTKRIHDVQYIKSAAIGQLTLPTLKPRTMCFTWKISLLDNVTIVNINLKFSNIKRKLISNNLPMISDLDLYRTT